MKYFSVAEAKANFSDILDGVMAGDEVIIIQEGKEIARLGSVTANKTPYSYEDLRAHLAASPASSGSAVVEMRELDRY